MATPCFIVSLLLSCLSILLIYTYNITKYHIKNKHETRRQTFGNKNIMKKKWAANEPMNQEPSIPFLITVFDIQ